MAKHSISKEHKQALGPVAIVLSGINEDLDNMIDDELFELRDACNAATETNCWVWTYKAAKYLGPVVAEHIERRGCVLMAEDS